LKVMETAQRRLRLLAARDWSFTPRASLAVEPPREHLFIAARPMASVDYYRAAPEAESSVRVVFDFELERWLGRDRREVIRPGTRVVLVRMPSRGWAQVLDAFGGCIAEVVWLIDDDVLAAREDGTLPGDYRLRLLSDYLGFKKVFERYVAKVWASTPTIASYYPPDRVELRPPSLVADRAIRRDWVTLFYHGTASHRGEHRFLREIFERVQHRTPRTVIEVCGDRALRSLYQGIPRMRVVHPVPWPDYLALLQAGRYDIGLVPLLDTPFNRARSGVKALEIAAIGATGLLSRRSPYTDYAHLPAMHFASDDPSDWVERILSLVALR
jgi:hypothetical protein